MKKQHFMPEHGSTTINGHEMEWTMQRCKTPSAFGVRGSRIFYLELKKDGKVVGVFNRGWDIARKPDKEDEETALCLSYLVDRFGREMPRKKKEMGSEE